MLESFLRRLKFRRTLSKQERVNAHAELATIRTYFHFTKAGETVPITSDFGPLPEFPEGCHFEQLAFFNDENLTTVVDTELWDAMDDMNRMALFAHEYFYRRYRLVGETSSIVVRKVVGLAFAKLQPNTPRVQDGVPESALACMTHGSGETYFYISRPDAKSTLMRFHQVMGRTTLWPTQIKLHFAVDGSALQIRPGNQIYIRDANANFQERATIESGPLAGYQIAVVYVYNRPFNLTLFSPSGELLRQVAVNGCKRRSEFDFGKILSEYSYIDPFQVAPSDLAKEGLIYFLSHRKGLPNRNAFAVIDFSRPSSEKRFFIFDVKSGQVTSTYVSHGIGTDPGDTGFPERFGQGLGSKLTSLGFYRAGEIRTEGHQKSVRLQGLSVSNSDAASRITSLKGADYVHDAPEKQGRSSGCFAVPVNRAPPLIEALHGGGLIYAGFSR